MFNAVHVMHDVNATSFLGYKGKHPSRYQSMPKSAPIKTGRSPSMDSCLLNAIFNPSMDYSSYHLPMEM